MIDRSTTANNLIGVSVSGTGALARIGDSVVTGNTTGLSIGAGADIESYVTNKIEGNTNPGDAPTPIDMQ